MRKSLCLNALTLVELIISIAISTIIMLFIIVFMSNSMEEISYSNRVTKFLSNFYTFEQSLNNLRSEFLTGKILINNSSGSDIIMLHDLDMQDGVVIGVVDTNTMKLDPILDYNIYKSKEIAYRKLGASEITTLYSNPSEVYNYSFFKDKVFEGIIVKDFQVETFNSGSLYDLTLTTNLGYNSELVGVDYSSIGNDDIEVLNINF